GDMTLKQFLEIAAGVVMGVIFYATGLPTIIKWPLIAISVLIGAALAFIPLEERPLEQWFLAFVRNVYSPTLFHWEKQGNVKYFMDETQATPTTAALSGVTTTDAVKLEESEKTYLNKVSSLFNPFAKPATNNAVAAPVNQVQPLAQVQPNIPQPGQTQTITIPSFNQNQGQVVTVNQQQGQQIQPKVEVPAGQKDVQIPQIGVVTMTGMTPTRPQMVVEEVSQQAQQP